MDVLSQCCATPTFGPGENLATVCIQHTDIQTFGQGMENSANMGSSGICRKASCKAEVSIGGFGRVLTAPAPLRLMRDPSQPKEVTSRSMLTSLDDLSVLSSFWAEERVSTCTAPQQSAFSALAYLRRQNQVLCSNIPQLLRCGNLAFLRSKSHGSARLLLY